MSNISKILRDHIGLAEPDSIRFKVADISGADGYNCQTLTYEGAEGDLITAYLFLPAEIEFSAGVVLFHQHNGQFHLGKSEIAGVVGDPYQAFGPALAKKGIVVLAPDAVTFEDRRGLVSGVEPDSEDWNRQYNSMAYRIVNGDTLMRKCLDDAQRAMSVLIAQKGIDESKVGVAGHSYGGTTSLYLAALDKRCRFACISGALASIKARKEHGTPLGMFEVVPGLAGLLDYKDLINAISPRQVLIVSSAADPYSVDADDVVKQSEAENLTEIRADGGHALDRSRFDAIVDWIVNTSSR